MYAEPPSSLLDVPYLAACTWVIGEPSTALGRSIEDIPSGLGA